jgi:putative phosphoribosyl transferase
VLNDDLLQTLAISDRVIAATASREHEELRRRERRYRGDRPPLDVRGRSVVLVDDGLATGSTMRAAIAGLRRLHPARIVVAVPVGGPDTCGELAAEADEAVCTHAPEEFRAVGEWYDDFTQTTDDEVRELLSRRASERSAAHPAATPGSGGAPR